MRQKENTVENVDLPTEPGDLNESYSKKFKLSLSKKSLIFLIGLFTISILILITFFLVSSWKFEGTNPTKLNESKEISKNPNDPNKSSKYNYSNAGKINLTWTSASVNTTHDTYYLFGEITTDGDLFHVDLLKNGELVNDYTVKVGSSGSLVLNYGLSNSFFVTGGDRTHKKFYFPVRDLIVGTNTIEVKLYSNNSREALLDEKSFSITRSSTTYSSDVSLYNKPQEVKAKQVFSSAGIDFEKEKLWEYFHDKNSGYFDGNTNTFFYGDVGNWMDYKVEMMGEIGVNNNKTPLYRLFYTYPSGGPGLYNNSLYFYIINKRAYFITKPLVSDQFVAPIYLFYMEPSPYIFKDTVAELKEIKVNDNNVLMPSTLPVGGLRYCDLNKVEGEVLYTYKSFKVYENFDIYDQYGHCENFRLVPEYFSDADYPGNDSWNERINPDFNKMTINLDDKKSLDGFYSPYWYWCAGSRGYRALDNGNDLEKVGKTVTGEDVYIYSKNMPFPKDTHLIPASTKEYPNYQVTEQKWQEFLDTQKETYPVLVIKDAFGYWVVYINADNFYVPGC